MAVDTRQHEQGPPAGASGGAASSPHLLRCGHSATALPDGRVLVLGGRKAKHHFNDLLCYNTANGSWQLLKSDPRIKPRTNHCAVLVAQRFVWVLGGSDENNVTADAWVLDAQTMTWSQPQLK